MTKFVVYPGIDENLHFPPAVRQELAASPEFSEKVDSRIIKFGVEADGPNTEIVGHPANSIASDITRSVILGSGTNAYNNVIGGDGANVNTTTPNTTQTGTGAHVSVVGGYDNSAGSLSSKIISDHSKTEVGGSGHNAIYGGANNIIKSTAQFSGIFSGHTTQVSGAYVFAAGYLNNASGQSSTVTGDHNTVSGAGSMADGTTNTVSGAYAASHGSTNTAAGNYSRAYGNYAHTRTVSQTTQSSGRFAALGDAQTSVIDMRRATTDATVSTLGVLGSSTSHQMLFNQTITYQILVVARDAATTDSAGWRIEGVMTRGATGSSIPVGSPVVTSLGASAGAAAWTVALIGDSLGGVNVRVTGEVSKTIRWVQRMTLVEVMV